MINKYLLRAIVIAAIIIITQTAFAADENGNVVKSAKGFNKIEVRGNIEVYLMDGDVNSVTTFNNSYGEHVFVQDQNNTLSLSAYTTQALVVYVTAADLRNVSVYDDAVVRSGKSFSSIELEINLYNHATAQLNLQAYNAAINVNDHAKVTLSGNITNCAMQVKKSSSVNSINLVAGNITRNTHSVVKAATKRNELASL